MQRRDPSKRRRLRRRLITAGVVCAALAGLLWGPPLPDRIAQAGQGSVRLVDAEGGLLRERPNEEGVRSEWVTLEDVPEAAVDATVAAEDRRLHMHPGVDPIAVARAVWDNAREGAVVSGASTLAMQLARLVWDLPRTLPGKTQQAALGAWLQLRLGPDGVLEAYLNLAPYAPDVRGIAMASRVFFRKPLSQLSAGEAVALACLPRAPSLYSPHDSGAGALRARRREVLALMHEQGFIDAGARDEAAGEPLNFAPDRRAFAAPHAVEVALNEVREVRDTGATRPRHVATTVEPHVQQAAQQACRDATRSLRDRGVAGCAVVSMRVSTGEILALVGSPDFDDAEAGQVNGALALRQPGSALKPFAYALAFERGYTPLTTIWDERTELPMPGGTWAPDNYDDRFHGPVRIRQALASSYNLPAVRLADRMGPAPILERMREAGLSSLTERAEHYGLGLVLGQGEVTLLELVTAYATLARGGEYLEPTILREVRDPDGRPVTRPARERRRVYRRGAAWLVGHILQDRDARRAGFGPASALELPFDAAAKTGTSSRFRDNWTVGWAHDVVVGVWVGHPRGERMQGVSGISGAAPVWRRVLSVAAGRNAPDWPEPPRDVRPIRRDDLHDYALAD